VKQIPPNLAANLCQHLQAEQVIIYARSEEGETIAYGGNNYKNGRIAEEMAEMLKTRVFGWAGEAADQVADDPVERAAQAEFDREAEKGKQLIYLPLVEKRQKDRAAGKLKQPEKFKPKVKG
jgi:hypothetical protein